MGVEKKPIQIQRIRPSRLSYSSYDSIPGNITPHKYSRVYADIN